MTEHIYGERLQDDIDGLRRRLMNSPEAIVDEETKEHHRFADGMHGLKVDCDKVETVSDLYIHMSSVYARAILDVYGDEIPDVLIGVANGANRFAKTIAGLIGSTALLTVKNRPGIVELDRNSKKYIKTTDISSGLVIEDVGTTGSTVWSLMQQLREINRIGHVEAMNLFQRSESLPYLEENRVPYNSVIFEPMVNYSPAQCAISGFCSRGIELIRND